MRRIKRLHELANRIPIRWRLTLVSLGVLTLLLGALGIIILLTAEQALLSSEAMALHNEARLAVSGIRGHPFGITEAPGPPPGPLPPDFELPAGILVRKLASASANATVLSLEGSVIVTGSDLSLIPPPVTLSPSLIQQALANDSQQSNYLLARDAHKQRQLVVLMPLVSLHHTIAILQKRSCRWVAASRSSISGMRLGDQPATLLTYTYSIARHYPETIAHGVASPPGLIDIVG